jgi:hypothetical protein
MATLRSAKPNDENAIRKQQQATTRLLSSGQDDDNNWVAFRTTIGTCSIAFVGSNGVCELFTTNHRGVSNPQSQQISVAPRIGGLRGWSRVLQQRRCG